MNDSDAITLQCLQALGGKALAILDENSYQLPALSCAVITNRLDIAAQHKQALFNDFDFSQTNLATSWVFRISKEKAINQHVISQALFHNATLQMIGYKNEGFNSLIKPIKTLADISIERHKNQLFCATIVKKPNAELEPVTATYHQLQALEKNGLEFISKPGCFGWNKIDAASQWLMDELATRLEANTIKRCLDLGAGYGYLSIRANLLGLSQIDATDNCAAAIIACQENFKKYHIEGEVISSNIGHGIDKKYDLILCNPPFHQGFDHNKQLIDDFCQQTAKMLTRHGKAYFVVNQFVAIEKSAKKHFTNCQILDTKMGFKIACLQ